jgi:homoaconitase/3-isopropylmalate dehydratase large subunit
MGCRDSEIYLGSPLSVAASAITGEITHPGRFL